MEELVIKQTGSFIHDIKGESNELDLLVKKGNTEIMLKRIEAGSNTMLATNEEADVMEFFYILEGDMIVQIPDRDMACKVLKKGDYFYLSNISQMVHIKAETNSSMLYISVKPTYETMSGIVKELQEITQKVMNKDMYTYEHNNRLHGYSIKIAEKLNLSQDSKENLVFAAQFHDIGKINVPDYILQKPAALNDEEFKYMKLHPTDGKKIIADTYIRRIGDIIEQHHERLDGSGYPKGLKKDDILWEAKIIAVVDSYDAMTTDRPYRKAMPPSVAMQELERLADIHYEKNVIEAFKSILTEQGLI